MRITVLFTLVALSCHTPASRLTPPQIVHAAGFVHPGDAWTDAYPVLVDQLGLPTRVKGAAYSWAARDGAHCYLIEVRTHHGIVTYVDDPYRPSPIPNGFRRCKRAAH